MAKHPWRMGQKVRVTEGVNLGTVGIVNRLGDHAVGLVTEQGTMDAGVSSLELLEEAPPPPPRPFAAAENPDGATVPEPAVLAALDLIEPLQPRVFAAHGRQYLSARGLAPGDVESARDSLADGSLGLHLSQFGTGPGLNAWLEWPGMGTLHHLSMSGAFLGSKGTEVLMKDGPLAGLESLDLSCNDIGRKGLATLRRADLPGLKELYLGANPDFDRGRYNQKALDVLLGGTKPMGSALQGLSILGLLFWDLSGAEALLETNPVLAGLDTLWIWDGSSIPESLAARCVLGWEKRPFVT